MPLAVALSMGDGPGIVGMSVPVDTQKPLDDPAAEMRGAQRVIGGLVLTGALIAVLILLFGLNLRDRTLDAVGRDLNARAALLADHAQRTLDSIDLLQQALVERIERSGPRTPEDLRQMLDTRANFDDFSSRLRSLPQIQAINVHDARGDQVLSTRQWPTKPGNIVSLPFFQRFLRDPVLPRQFTDPRISTADGAWMFYVERPIHNPQGAFIGTLGVAVDLGYFATLYATVLPSKGSLISLYRDDGMLLTRAPDGRARLGQKYLYGSLADLLPPGGPQSVMTRRLGVADGVERLVVGYRLQSYPMIVRVGIEMTAALASWREQISFLVLAAGLIELALVWVGRLVWRQARTRAAVAESTRVQRQAERERLEAALEMETLIATMPGVVIRLQPDADHVIRPVYISPTIEEMSGFTVEEISDPMWPAKYFSPGDWHRLRLAEHAALQNGAATVELEFMHRNGGVRRISGKMRGHRLENGQAEIVAVWTDVTAERQLSAQLEHAGKMAILGELTTGIAHELSQPLAAITMAAENGLRFAQRDAMPRERMLSKLQLILELAQRGADVLNHMRVFGRTGDVMSASVPLEGVLSAAVLLLRAKLTRAGVRLDIDMPANLPPAFGKAVPLEQVLLNVMSNSCDAYADAGDAVPQNERVIWVRGWVETGKVVIQLRDCAGGIPPSVLPRIFEPFFTTKQVGEGTGLGLSISYGIITDMGGTITAHNEQGGAVFRITLPSARV